MINNQNSTSKNFLDSIKKIESIQQLEGFNEVESQIRSVLSKQHSTQKSVLENSNIFLRANNLGNNGNAFGNIRLSSKSGKRSCGGSFRNSGKSIQLDVAYPIHAGQVFNDIIFSKKEKAESKFSILYS